MRVTATAAALVGVPERQQFSYKCAHAAMQPSGHRSATACTCLTQLGRVTMADIMRQLRSRPSVSVSTPSAPNLIRLAAKAKICKMCKKYMDRVCRWIKDGMGVCGCRASVLGSCSWWVGACEVANAKSKVRCLCLEVTATSLCL